LPSKREALSSIPSSKKERGRKEGRKMKIKYKENSASIKEYLPISPFL
jgi:hypothetical protein